MRLQNEEIQTIIRIAKEIYGDGVKVFLFSSRLDDKKKGGDIDLLIRTENEKKGVLARIRMLSRLKLDLGDQKIDIIEVCDKHILRINEALKGLGLDLPISPDCYASLSAEQVRCIDQFIFRFSKLQDAVGAKIFPVQTNGLIFVN